MDIPGYYFDREKKRYFKVESSNTAPSAAAYSSDNVKRRKVEDEENVATQQRAHHNKNRLRTCRALDDPLLGGFLAREYGAALASVPPSAFAHGLVNKGSIPLADARWRSDGNLKHLCVTSDDARTGLGVAFGTLDETTLISTYVPRDASGRLHRRLLAHYNVPGNHMAPYQELLARGISDVKYDARSRRILVVDHAGGRPVLWNINPIDAAAHTSSPRTPEWTLGGSPRPDALSNGRIGVKPRGVTGKPKPLVAQAILPGLECDPNTLALLACNTGLVRCRSGRPDAEDWYFPSRRASSPGETTMGSHIFTLDYKASDPNLVLCGGRRGDLFLGDLRIPDTEWPSRRHGTSIIHIKSVGEHNVLVAGLQNSMDLYDTRMLSEEPLRARRKHQNMRPCLTFSAYRNEANPDVGLDLCRELGLVAAAHDDGTVALYSVKTGRRLSSPDLDAVRSTRGAIRSVQFQTMYGDTNPTLFVGVHSNLQAFSFGVRDMADEA